MKKYIVCLIGLFLLPIHGFAQTDRDRQAILRTLDEQTTQWNKGDMQGFMLGYWQSDSLRFIGKSGLTYGWQQTLNNYKKNYPDGESRGTLRFQILHVDFLSNESAYVIGKFLLLRPQKGDASGHFTLLWKKIKGKWVIVADHSS